jgi:uncharacterized protein
MRLLAAVVLVCALSAQTPQVVRVRMRDGVRLSTSVFLPHSPGPYSTLLVRTPYGKGTSLLSGYKLFLDRQFAVVVQDVRGRYASEGVFRPPLQEDRDGADTISWVASQPWSDGKVGMLGGSYLGIAQWRAALQRQPQLRAIFPIVSGSDEYLDRFYSPGGALKVGHRMLWIAENFMLPHHPRPPFTEFVRHLPLRTMDRVTTGQSIGFYQEALNHPAYDAYWRSRSTRERLHEVNIPAYIVGGWYDNYVESDLATFVSLTKRSGAHRVMIGPWPHAMEPLPRSGAEARVNIRAIQAQWFEHWMRGPQPVPNFPAAPVRIFVMGANRWRDEQEWPIARTKYTPLYLNAGKALAAQPQASGYERYTYDPRHPVPTMGGAVCCNPKIFPPGPMDQREVESRDDVLIYSSQPLRRDIEVTGEIRVVLHISTTATDTDFTAKLVDVHPDGYARNLCDGILRLRFRAGLDKPQLAKPGTIYAITIPAGVTSNVFRAGHRVRIEISSSNFPRFNRNPNTGRAIADETELRLADQTVYHGTKWPSHVILPVIP